MPCSARRCWLDECVHIRSTAGTGERSVAKPALTSLLRSEDGTQITVDWTMGSDAGLYNYQVEWAPG